MSHSVPVSVVIASYNHAAFLCQTIDSALAQEWLPSEILVVDDGSTDATRSVLAAYKDVPSVRYMYVDHVGAAEARNIGWRSASHSTIAFLDADDWWLPTKLMAQLPLLGPEVGLVYCDTLRVDAQGKRLTRWQDTAPPIEGHVFVEQLLQNRIQTSTVVTTREVIDGVGGFDPTMTAWEDIDLWNRIAARYPLAYTHSTLACYRMLPGSLSSRSLAMANGRMKSTEKLVDGPTGQLLTTSQKEQAYADAHLQLAVAHYLNGNMKISRRHLLAALDLRPSMAIHRSSAGLLFKSLLGRRVTHELRRLRRGHR